MDQDGFSRQVLCLVESELTEALTSLSSQVKVKRSSKLTTMARECESQLAQDVASLKEMCFMGGVFAHSSLSSPSSSSLTQQIQLTLLDIQAVQRRTQGFVDLISHLEPVVLLHHFHFHQRAATLASTHRKLSQATLRATRLASGLCPNTSTQQPTALCALNQQLLLV